MNVLDENIVRSQRQQLMAWKIHFQRIGDHIGSFGMDDREQIVPLLHTIRRPTFFTRDRDFYHPKLRHAGYCLVYLDIEYNEVAEYIRRFLRHRAFRTHAQRLGKVIRVRHSGLSYWQVSHAQEHVISW